MANVQKITNSEIIGMAKAVIDFNSVMASAEKKGYIENLAKVNDQVGYVIKAYEANIRKSIALEDIKANGYLIKQEFNPRINYLKLVDQIYFK